MGNRTRLAWLCLVILLSLVSEGLNTLHRWPGSHHDCSAEDSGSSGTSEHNSRTCRICQILFSNLVSCLAEGDSDFPPIQFEQKVLLLANDGLPLQTVPSCLTRRGPPA